MSRGTLTRAARTLRETTQRDPLDAAQVDARFRAVLDDLPPMRERRSARWLAAAAVLLVTGLFGGWAGATGRIGRALEAAAAWVTPAPRNTALRPARPVKRGRAAAPEAPVPLAVTPLPEPAVAPEPAPAAVPSPALVVAPEPAPKAPAASRRPAAPAVPPETPPPAVIPPPLAPAAVAPAPMEGALYDDGHRAQFVARDYAYAVRAWDLYLERHPAGRLAPEARYNRAIALFRLGRRSAAAAALAPFAGGDYGTYRRAEARALLKALGSTD